MSGPTTPGSPPPEVPEEFAAAYRAAYEQALAAQTGGPQHREHPEPEGPWDTDADIDNDSDTDNDSDEDVGDGEDTDQLPVRRGPLRVGTHRSTQSDDSQDDDTPTWFEKIRDSSWFVPLLLVLLTVLLILGAYVVGLRFAGQLGGQATPSAEPGVVIGRSGTDGEEQPVTNRKPRAGAWDGRVARIGDVQAKAGCTSKAGVDSSGAKVAYDAGNLTDGVADTTWRCDGSAVGEKITFHLGKDVPIGQVGLIPGYAKTDEETKADRYAENNRVTRVRWTIGDTEVIQRLSGAPDDRSLVLVRIPRTTTDTVELEILAVAKGPRDTTAISEIQLGRAG